MAQKHRTLLKKAADPLLKLIKVIISLVSLNKVLSSLLVMVEDQIFEMCGSACVNDKNEVEVQVRVQKGYVKLKQAVRKTQARYLPGDGFEISLIRLST